MLLQGEVIRFDHVKGYGFIAPRRGGEDVFVHANDLLDDKHLLAPGAEVEFVVEDGDRGLKALSVRILAAAGTGTGTAAGAGAPAGTGAGAGVPAPALPADAAVAATAAVPAVAGVPRRAWTPADLTEALLRIDPPLVARQILAIRDLVTGGGGVRTAGRP